MTNREFMKWLKTQGKFNTLQELYAIVLEGNHGIEAVKEWIDGKAEYYDADLDETVVFYTAGEQTTQSDNPHADKRKQS